MKKNIKKINIESLKVETNRGIYEQPKTEIIIETFDTIDGYQIVRNNASLDLFYTYEQEILDEKEKEYLSNIIKPFRNKIRYISLESMDDNEGFIYIANKKPSNNIALPDFKIGTMYKKMELGKHYTLEELGL